MHSPTISHKAAVADYLAAGVKLAITVDPIAKAVALHRVGGPVQILSEHDTLRLEEFIPAFALSLAELFRP